MHTLEIIFKTMFEINRICSEYDYGYFHNLVTLVLHSYFKIFILIYLEDRRLVFRRGAGGIERVESGLPVCP